jgi:hypothetical protein
MKPRNILLPLIALSLVGCDAFSPDTTAPDADHGKEKVSAKIAIVVDGTGSFTPSLGAASLVVSKFINRNATLGDAEVYVYRLDNAPRLVTRLHASEFLSADQSVLLKSLGAATPGTGTDVVGAMEMAVKKLQRDDDVEADRKVLLVFTDGFIDPMKEGGVTHNFRRYEDFDWGSLNGIETHMYFLENAPYEELTRVTKDHGAKVELSEAGEGARAGDLQNIAEGS